MKKSPRLALVSSAVLRGVRTEHARAVRRIYGDRGGHCQRRYYGIYAFVRADFVHPPLPDISRSLKATKFDVSVLIEYDL